MRVEKGDISAQMAADGENEAAAIGTSLIQLCVPLETSYSSAVYTPLRQRAPNKENRLRKRFKRSQRYNLDKT